MSWIAVGVAGASLLGGVIGSSGAKSAANTQAGAAEYAADIGKQEFNTITQQESPYMYAGYGAQGALDWGLGINPQSSSGGMAPGYDYQTWGGGSGGSGPAGMTTVGGPGGTGMGYGSLLSPFTADMMKQYSPAYQFQLQQGQQGVLNGVSSGQGALSGAASKDLIDYNQNEANTAFNNAFNQYQTQQGNIYSRLAGVAQLGQNAAANTGAQGTQLAGNIAQSVTNAGTAAAAGQVGSANAWSGALSSAAPWLAYGANSGSNSQTGWA